LKTKGIYFLYRFLQGLGLQALIFYFLFRGLRNGGYWRSLPQRFGFLPRSFRQTGPGAIWLHAVSVGEILACVELLRGLRTRFPQTAVFVSTSTLAGRAMAGEKLAGLAHGVFYAPVDYVFAVRRVLRALRPSVVAVAETEIWPNLIREVKRTGAGLTIVNGRISDRALPRYLRFRWFFRAVLPAVDSVLAQSDAMRDRFLALGAPAGRVQTGGNLKYDFSALAADPGSPVAAWIDQLRPAQVWIAASTMPPAEPGDVDEDDAVLDAFREAARSHPDLALILAPRKPERFDVAARKLEAAGIGYVRRSALGWQEADDEKRSSAPLAPARVLLLDTIGELSGLFALADVVFMGGTLARRGGHNILEPALFGKPVIAGPHMENFQAIADDFRAAAAYVEIGQAAELAGAVERVLEDPGPIGQRALACAEARRGAAARAVAEIRELHARGVPLYRPAMPWFALAWALSRLWEWGGRRKWARDLKRARKLDVPVIGVGNLSMGGTGKTPCVLRLAELLKERGRKPGILTRGYGRGSPRRQLAIAAGAVVSAARSGDEPQIFVRSGLAPVGVGRDRFQAGQLLRREFGVDALLLDDGFQHARLERDVDIVLIDALEPFGRGGVFPLGRLREPLDGLARASMILITRSAFSDLAEAIERVVRQWNPDAPIFHGGVQPRAWVDLRNGTRYSPEARPFKRAGAVCGLGNPQAFRHTLEQMGVEPVDWVEFEDHHRYRPRELRRVAQQFAERGATAIATTEKDAVNLCDGCDELAAPLEIYWLQVAMKIEREDEFLREIERRMGGHVKMSDSQ
jgi:tetraacyldisaccharide 4'-kinase